MGLLAWSGVYITCAPDSKCMLDYLLTSAGFFASAALPAHLEDFWVESTVNKSPAALFSPRGAAFFFLAHHTRPPKTFFVGCTLLWKG